MAALFVFEEEVGMGLEASVKEIWKRVAGVEASGVGGAAENVGERKTTVTPLGMNSIFAPFRTTGIQNALPKPTAANLRRFAETPVARRAINCIKDRIACMDWRIEVRQSAGPDLVGDRGRRVESLTRFPERTRTRPAVRSFARIAASASTQLTALRLPFRSPDIGSFVRSGS